MSCRRFNGSSQYLLSASSPLSPSAQDFSCSCWFNLLAYPAGGVGNNAVLVGQQNGTGTGRAWLEIDNGVPSGATVNSLDSFLGGHVTPGVLVPILGQWYHACVTVLGTTIACYGQGILLGSQVLTPEAATGSIVVGANKGLTVFSNVMIRDVAIWKGIALRAGDVLSLAQGIDPRDVYRQYLQAFWPLNGEGATNSYFEFDQTPNAPRRNDLTLSVAPTVGGAEYPGVFDLVQQRSLMRKRRLNKAATVVVDDEWYQLIDQMRSAQDTWTREVW